MKPEKLKQTEPELISLADLDLSEEELFSRIDNNSLESEKITAPRYSYWHSVFRVFFRNRLNIFLLVCLVLILIFSYVYPAFSGYDRFEHLLDATTQHLMPAKAFERFGFNIHTLLGTGATGEYTFDAIWEGAKISLSLGFICAAINMTVGVIIGCIWGFSKKVDAVMMVIYNVIGNIPGLLIMSVLVMILTASFWTMVFAITITGWLFIAYFIRTQVVIIRDREYNLASRCLGTSTLRIALKNILPFMTSVIVTVTATEIPGYINTELFLSYIGLGIKEMSLGKLIEMSQTAMVTPGWGFEFWSPVILASIVTVILYVVGQNLGDASDPKTHR